MNASMNSSAATASESVLVLESSSGRHQSLSSSNFSSCSSAGHRSLQRPVAGRRRKARRRETLGDVLPLKGPDLGGGLVVRWTCASSREPGTRVATRISACKKQRKTVSDDVPTRTHCRDTSNTRSRHARSTKTPAPTSDSLNS